MKVRSSVKTICEEMQIIKEKGCNPRNLREPKHKQRQG